MNGLTKKQSVLVVLVSVVGFGFIAGAYHTHASSSPIDDGPFCHEYLFAPPLEPAQLCPLIVELPAVGDLLPESDSPVLGREGLRPGTARGPPSRR